jgi:hypothetical protein
MARAKRHDILARILDVLRSEYGGHLKVYEVGNEYVEATETDGYRDIKAQTTPGDAIRIYRENFAMIQSQQGIGCRIRPASF